jgi:excisionase family DNA binding protein
MKKLKSARQVTRHQTTRSTTDLPAFLTVAEVATLLRRAPRSIYDLVEKNLIPYLRPPGTRLIIFEKRALLDWLRVSPAPTQKPPS